MPAVDFDRTGALFFKTVDDTADANIFGQNCLDLPGDKIGELVVLDSLVSRVDSFSEMHVYRRSAPNGGGGEILMGARVDTTNGNDGYYGGLDAQFFPSVAIFTRISGVLTRISPSASSTLLIDTEYIFQFIVKGTDLEFRIIRASDQVTIDAAFASDSTFSNSGTGSIFKPSPTTVARRLRIDKYSVTDVI